MFTQHPKTSEFFDIESFVEDNISSLRDMYEQGQAELLSTGKDVPEDDRPVQIAIWVAIAVYADQNDLVFPLKYDDGDEDGICAFASELTVLMTLFSLEDKGYALRKGAKFGLSPKGKEAVKEVNDSH